MKNWQSDFFRLCGAKTAGTSKMSQNWKDFMDFWPMLLIRHRFHRSQIDRLIISLRLFILILPLISESLWQKPLLFPSVTSSNTRIQENLSFLHCILMQCCLHSQVHSQCGYGPLVARDPSQPQPLVVILAHCQWEISTHCNHTRILPVSQEDGVTLK